MLEAYRAKHILEWKIPNQDDYNAIVALVHSKYTHLHNTVIEQFGPNGWYIIGLFALLLMIIMAIYIKSIIDTFRAGNEELSGENPEPDGLFYTIEENPIQSIANDNDDEQVEGNESESYQESLRSSAEDLDKELSLNLLRASQDDINETERRELSSNIKKRMKLHSEVENSRLKELKLYLENKPQNENSVVNETTAKNENLVSIIINLLGRGVSVAKINQSLYFHYKTAYDINDIIHTVQSVCNFIGLCNAGKFDYLPQRQMLPENDAAIYAWANGDNSLALILLQSFLNQLMEQSQEEIGIIKDMTYALASNCACIMGDIAKLKDIDLAHNSFELATELSSKNVIAWSRLGDIYMLEDAMEKAMISYQNVIDIADIYLYAAELAHAKQQLASYYQKQEVYAKAEQLQKESKKYYDDTGIYNDLTEKEILAYNTISEASSQNLRQYIYNLLNTYHF
ncbi:MAG: hypothetical protein IJ677_01180 [Alphaproteobacteria bacterium]|nr:hypothetical protein [Alphaproteobacteria bacterium]